MNAKRNQALAIIAAVIAIAALWIYADKNGRFFPSGKIVDDSGLATTTDASASEGTQETVDISGESLEIADQPEGLDVGLKSVTLSKPSWVAIKDENGWILGAARFDESAENVSVPLLRATLKGLRYGALIYVDNGDRAFDFHTDMPVVNQDRDPYSVAFTAN